MSRLPEFGLSNTLFWTFHIKSLNILLILPIISKRELSSVNDKVKPIL